jgi:hypothetical protein
MATYDITHTTDALLRAAVDKTHTTDALLKATLDKTHTTDTTLKWTFDKTHKTDTQLGWQGVTVFGTYLKGAGFTDGSTNPIGLEPWIEIMVQIGASPIDVTVTYVDQDGHAPETTTVSTSIPSGSTVGTLIKVALNTGDYALRDVTNITITGGTNGDKFKIRSLFGAYWGKSFPVIKATHDSYKVDDLSGHEYSKPPMPALVKNPPNYYPSPSPQMNGIIPFVRRTWDSFLPETLSGIVQPTKIFAFVRRLWDAYTGDPIGTQHTGKTFTLQSSLFGNIVAGYLRLPSGTLITDGFRVIFKNSAGFSVWGKCYPTGVYQVLLDLQRYDKSYLIVGSTAIEIYYQYGAFYVDGYVNQNTSMDLYFIQHSNDPHILGFKKRLWP